ncbi:MAG TPA: transglycosylase domain-containing protein [Leptospiraceae bacterium]|nr:transglycosylase domain-containing protein [Leptospiraceae bacterium]HMW06134.1 transglycosylase domain-containing protein [Leptospiraceae bacterium]HMX30738.1 transglycosylase domain-containing protein [Leptospiraceae bacterium]HMY31795.1 transglycosylase domain-containing protein [Leptospiraceae bacterium]HMZ63126.1 transglycosylase domain-containing protein [Leptospiraceae bacterium]
MAVLRILYHSFLNLLSFLNSIKWRVFRLISFVIVFSIIVLCLSAYIVWIKEKPNVKANLDKYRSEVSNYYDSVKTKPIRIYDKNSKLIGEFNRRNFKPIRTDNLQEHANIVWALLSSEDRDFYKHGGINYSAIGRAILVNLTKFRLLQGGSTITQQLSKLTLNLGERNIYNKITEAFCTYYIENQYDKDTILAMYMNQIFLGEGNTGLEEASRYYFNKSATKLTPAESALLVGIIPAPSVYNPIRNLGISLERQKRILNDMAKNINLHMNQKQVEKDFPKKIDESIRQFKNAYKIVEVKVTEKVKYTSDIGKFGIDRDFKLNLAPDFNESIRRYVLEKFTNDELEKTSLNIYTTLDYEKQSIIEASLREGIEDVRKVLEKEKQAYSKKGNDEEAKRESEIIDSMNGSAVSLNPYNGNVEALIGAYKISSIYRLNRAEEIKRQPGSSIKGIIFALALEKKIITPSSIVKDEKINIGGYTPKNWYGSYKGYITARQALAQSVNTVAVKLLQEVGVNYFLEKMSLILSVPVSDLKERFGNNLSLALGSGELSPMELAIVYSTIANGGIRIRPKKIIKITDDDDIDRTPPELYAEEQAEQILDPVACAMAVNLLESVLSPEGTLPARSKDKLPLAGKTGTVQTPKKAAQKWGNRKGIRDSWFAGIFPGNVTTIWVGNDQSAPFPGSGAGISGQVWLRYVSYMKSRIDSGEKLIKPFEGDFVQVDICGEQGILLQDAPECKYPIYAQYYYRGTEPGANSSPPEVKIEPQKANAGAEEGISFEDEPDVNFEYPKEEPKDPEPTIEKVREPEANPTENNVLPEPKKTQTEQ